MRRHDRHLILKYVERMGEISAHFGVAYNQEIKSKHFREVQNEFIAGSLTREGINEFLNAPYPWEQNGS